MAGFRTSGATVAAAALLVAAGGFLSLAGSNSVSKDDIRKGAVGKSEIRSNAVGHSELRTGSVRGAEVDEATLGTVPSAGTVGGKSAAQLDTRWALVSESGVIERQTGGFTIVNCYASNANCYIDAGEDVTNNGLSAQVSVANTDGSPVLAGEAGVAACGAATVNCGPAGTETPNVIVVAPRQSDGTVPGGAAVPNANNALRFYVFVTGSEG
jgi:hypothetical protein